MSSVRLPGEVSQEAPFRRCTPSTLRPVCFVQVLERNGLARIGSTMCILGCVSQVGDKARTSPARRYSRRASTRRSPRRRSTASADRASRLRISPRRASWPAPMTSSSPAGVESMSRVPLGSSNAGGKRSRLLDERYPEGLVNQGVSAELIAQKWGLTRAELDEFSAESHRRAADAWAQAGSTPKCFRSERRAAAVTTDETVRAGTTAERSAGFRRCSARMTWSPAFPTSTGRSHPAAPHR